MVFLMDKDARPTPKDMKLWVDVVRFIKRGAKGGALGFFTYMELSAFSFLPSFKFFASCLHNGSSVRSSENTSERLSRGNGM